MSIKQLDVYWTHMAYIPGENGSDVLILVVNVSSNSRRNVLLLCIIVIIDMRYNKVSRNLLSQRNDYSCSKQNVFTAKYTC